MESKSRKSNDQRRQNQSRVRARQQFARPTILLVILALSLNIGLAYWGHQTWIEESRALQLKTISRTHAQAAADSVSVALHKLQKRLDLAAQSADVAVILDKQNPEAMSTLEQRLQRRFEAAVGLRVLLPNPAKHWPEGATALSFAELDMVARAEKRQAVFPEAAKRDEQWIVDLVSPVPADASMPVTGTLLLTLQLNVLQPALVDDRQELGRVELLQSFGQGKATTLLTSGNGEAGEPQTAAIDNSYWQIRFTPSSRLWHATDVNLLLPIALLLVTTLASVTLAIWLGRLLNRSQLSKASPVKEPQRTRTQTRVRNSSAEAAESDEADDILDIEIADEDEALLGLDEVRSRPATPDSDHSGTATPSTPAGASAGRSDVPEVIFRAYDIRGLAETEITPALARQIGQALGSEALGHRQNALVVAQDARTHSPVLAEHLVKGILSTGCHVINIGTVPTPLMYFATETLNQTQSGVMVTASHNAAEYNGFKVVMVGKSRSADDIQNVRKRIMDNDFYSGSGGEEHLDIVPQYIDTIFSDVALAGDMHVVLDAGNGVTGAVAPRLFEELGCQVTSLYCDLDGRFPNHEPDPSIAANLQHLIARVQQEKADVGIAFDGDGDRLTVVTPTGEIIWSDRLLMLFAKDILARNPGADVVFDIKSTRQLGSAISRFGGRPIMWKTGHAPMRAKILETGALLGGEFSGHVFIKDRWYGFDDGIYAAARLIEVMSLRGEDLDTIFAEFPPTLITPEIRLAVAEDKKFAIVRRLIESGDFDGAELTTLDGLRADFPFGWGLIRASNTSANLTLRFEADDEQSLQRIIDLFARELQRIDTGLQLTLP